ncbi:class 1b ribonucleoside-diphosphate reductase subunit beta [Paenibacillus sp. 1P03SA]|uniref:class 1b ribonucleoside-diphosphate reductase subunit beta n=1 Tax=Paenibacillus sp. 1P03SA TaxID=3132294 RepID=UPI0039A2B42F
MRAVNWNRPDDAFSAEFFDRNFMQIWTEKEIPLSDDKMSWISLSPAQQKTYKRVLGGLTFLDTEQGAEGMPLISLHVESEQRKAVLAIMGFMEHIHARSYSSIFTTLATTEEIDEVFAWVESNPYLQYKGQRIAGYYRNIDSKLGLYLAMTASVFLESGLFYSGFYYPLLLSGHGQMVASGEVISLILRDEAVHGQYVGTLAQEVYTELSPEEQLVASISVKALLDDLYENEAAYTREVYGEIGLTDDVLVFLRYNFNRAMMNLGLDPVFPEEIVNPVVMNGIRLHTKNHDFFSTKGNGYIMATNIVKLNDTDFVFEDLGDAV